jgi:hypothetical protein
MGLSLSVLVALALLLPGAAFVFAVTRLHSPTAPSTGLEQQLSLSLAVALVAAIIAHLLLLLLLQAASQFVHGLHGPDLLAVFELLGGHNQAKAGAPLRALSEHPFCTGSYIIGATTGMWLAGKWVNTRIDTRERADWYQLLKPADADFVVMTADVAIGSGTYLFKGVVLEFRISKTGDLERVVLFIAARKSVPMASQASMEGMNGLGSSLGHGWTEVPGEKVVLQMRDARTINLDYFWTRRELSDTDGVGRLATEELAA